MRFRLLKENLLTTPIATPRGALHNYCARDSVDDSGHDDIVRTQTLRFIHYQQSVFLLEFSIHVVQLLVKC